MSLIRPLTSEYDEYRRDESRTVGEAQSISFPTSEDEVRQVLRELAEADAREGTRTPVTVQGGRTGLAAGAVPHGGHAMNLSKMNRVLGIERADAADSPDGTAGWRVVVEPGVILSQLRKGLEDRNLSTAGWDEESLSAWRDFCDGREYFFPTDPTEVSALIGGMVACNASGARTYGYGPVRPYVHALRVVLADGDAVELERGQVHAKGRSIALPLESGRTIDVELPDYTMPDVKNASGYWAADDMDAVDLFVGSDGTLGVIVRITLDLLPVPEIVWGVSCFFADETHALDFTCAVRPALDSVYALEYFDADALDILRAQKAGSTAFAALLEPPAWARACVYAEIDCASEDEAYDALYTLGQIVEQSGGSEDATWVARTAIDREQQRFFRHAVPESVNMLIDERRKSDPTITKLGSDMSVPDSALHDVVAMYRRTLSEGGFQTAVWGHIGDNHLHVNILPRDHDEHARGKELYKRWAATITQMGGAVSAEHGVGKIKRDFLTTMYGEEHVRQMARTKLALDPRAVLGRGNLFSEELLDEEAAR